MSNLSVQEQEQLRVDKLLLGLTEQQGYREVLRPWLEEKRSKSYPDPTQFKNTKEFLYAATVASLFKKVVAELLHYLEVEVPDRVKALEDKEKGEVKDFGIGRR